MAMHHMLIKVLDTVSHVMTPEKHVWNLVTQISAKLALALLQFLAAREHVHVVTEAGMMSRTKYVEPALLHEHPEKPEPKTTA